MGRNQNLINKEKKSSFYTNKKPDTNRLSTQLPSSRVQKTNKKKIQSKNIE